MENKDKKTLITFVVIVSLVCGVVGGLLGVTLTATSSSLQNALGINGSKILTQGNREERISVKEDSAVVDSVKKVSPAVVSVVFTKDVTSIDPFNFYFGNGATQQQKGSGSGFIITSDGLIVTNKHVASVEGAKYSVITSDGKTYDARVLAQDPLVDMAVLKIEAKGLPVVEFGNSDDLEVGQRIIAIGNSLGEFQNSVTVGVLSAKERSLVANDQSGNNSENLEGLLQTDAAINQGNSGGPMLNIKGQVIGINTATVSKSEAEGIGFAIPISSVSSGIESVKKTGKLTRPYLGVRYASVNKQIAGLKNLKTDNGALVIGDLSKGLPAVVSGSPAEKAGIKDGDVIIEISGKKLDESHSLMRILGTLNPGEQVDVKIIRDSKEISYKVTLGEASE